MNRVIEISERVTWPHKRHLHHQRTRWGMLVMLGAWIGILFGIIWVWK